MLAKYVRIVKHTHPPCMGYFLSQSEISYPFHRGCSLVGSYTHVIMVLFGSFSFLDHENWYFTKIDTLNFTCKRWSTMIISMTNICNSMQSDNPLKNLFTSKSRKIGNYFLAFTAFVGSQQVPLKSDQYITYKQKKKEARKPASRSRSELGLITNFVMHQQTDQNLTNNYIVKYVRTLPEFTR